MIILLEINQTIENMATSSYFKCKKLSLFEKLVLKYK